MIRNYIKIAWRNIVKNKGFSLMNIFGLAVGITCASLIFLWVEDELDYDSYFDNRDNIYLVLTNQSYEGKWRTFGSTPGPMGPAMKQEIPGIDHISRTRDADLVFSIGDKAITQNGLYADASFFDIFRTEMIAGDKKNIFDAPNTVIISDKTARQFFGSAENSLYKNILLDHKEEYTITGVYPDLPDNVSLKYDFVISYPEMAKDKDYLHSWGNNSVSTYVSLSSTADRHKIDATLRKMIEAKTGDHGTEAFLFAMTDWRLRSNFEDGVQTGGNITYVRLFSIIAWMILIIACINFMNLATAKSEKRANEVGVRKVMGAARRSLFIQFLTEAMGITAIALLLSLACMALLLPQFNLLVQKNMELGLSDPLHLTYLLTILVFCGFLSGSYPSVHLALLRPIETLKGKKTSRKRSDIIRKALVITQFSVSVILIIGTITVYQQIKHVQSRPMGYDTKNLVKMRVQGNMVQNFRSIRNELIKTGTVQHAGLNSYNTLSIGNNTSSVNWKGKDPSSEILFSVRLISPEFLKTMGMEIMDGSDFKPGAAPDTTRVIITESLARMMGPGPATGKTLEVYGDPVEVIGTVKDYLYGNMYGKSDPVIFMNYPDEAKYMYIRTSPTVSATLALEKIQQVMEKNNPGYPFEYEFVDDNYQAMFRNEKLVGRLSRIFSALAIGISCIGLFGLAAYMAEQRKKEISIRKILGASIRELTVMLSGSFIKLVALSCIIAFPVAWYILRQWLQRYSYRIDMPWWPFVVAGAGAISIALITVSFQAIKAALTNPVKNIQNE